MGGCSGREKTAMHGTPQSPTVSAYIRSYESAEVQSYAPIPQAYIKTAVLAQKNTQDLPICQRYCPSAFFHSVFYLLKAERE